MKHLLLLLLSVVSFSACQQAGSGAKASDARVDSATQAIDDAMLTAEDRGPSVTLDAPVMLLYRMKPGDSFGYSIENIEDVTIMQDTIPTINHQVIRWWYRFEVVEAAPGGGARLRAHCDRVMFEGKYDGPGGAQAMQYDSREKNTYDIEKRFAQYNAPVHTPFMISVEKDGRISDISNLRDVVRNYLKDDYRTTKSDQLAAIERDYADSGIKAVLQLAFQKLADTPVGKDSTWTLVRPDKIGYLAVRSIASYGVRDVINSPRGTLAHIDAEITSEYVGAKTMDTGQGMATMNEFSVQGKGGTVFNLDAGRVQRRRLRTDVHVKMWIEPPEDLKRMMPDQMHDFWYSQKASIVNVIEPYASERTKTE